MTEEKMLELVQRIDAKTAAGALKWERTAIEEEFQTTLSSFIVRVRREETSEGDVHSISLVDKGGTLLESITGGDLFQAARDAGKEASHPHIVIRNIFKNAKRQALGVEKAIDDILSELKDDEL